MKSKIITLTIVALTLLFTPPETRAESPFSSLGHGLLVESANARSAAMGFTSLAIIDTLSLDQRNIAAWGGPATARLGLGGEFVRTSVDDINGSDLRDQGGISGLAVAIPIYDDSFFGLAISRLTRVDYNWAISGSAVQDWSSTIESHQGSGGMSQGILGVSFPYKDNLRFGIGARAIFGKIDRLWKIEFPDEVSQATSHLKSNRFKGFGISTSAHYNMSPSWLFGFSINNPISVRIQRQSVINAGSNIQTDSTKILSENWDIPLDAAFGIGHIMNEHSFTGEVAIKGWGSATEPEELAENFEDALRLSFGWEWVPEYSAFDPIWRAFTYRGGLYTQEHYALSASGNQSRRTALTGGLGIPFNRGNSRIDLAVELGLMGAESDDGVAEKFAVVTLGFNNSELWFKGLREGR